jgi:hypothetical protein
LEKALDEALRPKVQLLASGEPVNGVPRDGLVADRANAKLLNLLPSGSIAPGLYTGLALNSQQRILLNRGDRLLLRLRSDGEQVRFERSLLADEFPKAEKPRAAAGDWVLTVLQNRRDVTPFSEHLRLLAALETTRGRAPGPDGVLQQTRPGFVWWEVAPAGRPGGAPKVGLARVTDAYGYPAPAWELTVDDWPADQAPRLRAWCAAAPPPVVQSLALDPERVAAGTFQEAVEADGRRATVSVALEEQKLATEADGAEPRPVSCLVVRVYHAPDRPILARLTGSGFDGEAHSFYRSASAYTGVFGPLTLDRLRGLNLHLELLSVEQFKAAATPITLDDLPPPRVNDAGLPPLKLRTELNRR